MIECNSKVPIILWTSLFSKNWEEFVEAVKIDLQEQFSESMLGARSWKREASGG